MITVQRCASFAFGIAAFGAAYLACAETVYRQDTPAAVRWALRRDAFAPPAPYFERLADLDQADLDQADLDQKESAAALDAALLSDPRRTAARLSLALAAESQGRLADAERDLREAAHLDRQYQPAWTLANFYFRQNDSANFWIWARRAAALTADYRPLLRLANASEPHAGAVLSRLEAGAPLERAELDDVLTRADAEGVRTVAQSLAARQQPSDKLRLKTTVDWQIRQNRAHDAVELWNTVTSSPLDPAAGQVLTNGGFAHAPESLGFDWRIPSLDGLTARWNPSGREILSLSGTQPERCVLLEQILPLDRPRLRLRFEYSTSGMDASTGLRWNLDGQDAPAWEPAPGGRSNSFIFRQAHSGLSRLILLYRREPGSVRVRGRIEIWNVSAESL
jgi:hypothetical protein